MELTNEEKEYLADRDKPNVKTTVKGTTDILFDLSDYPASVTNYVLDQFNDHMLDVETHAGIDIEIDLDYKAKTIEVTNIALELIRQIIEEKEADEEREKRGEI